MVTLLWFRRDLRLADNPALSAANALGRPIIPVFLLDDADAGEWVPGGASRWWLHGSLDHLAHALSSRGSRLIFRRGPAEASIEKLVAETGAQAVFWNRRYEPWAAARDEQGGVATTRDCSAQLQFRSAQGTVDSLHTERLPLSGIHAVLEGPSGRLPPCTIEARP